MAIKLVHPVRAESQKIGSFDGSREAKNDGNRSKLAYKLHEIRRYQFMCRELFFGDFWVFGKPETGKYHKISLPGCPTDIYWSLTLQINK